MTTTYEIKCAGLAEGLAAARPAGPLDGLDFRAPSPWGDHPDLAGLQSRALSGEESMCQCRRCRFDPWVGKVPCRRGWQPTAVFSPGGLQSKGPQSQTRLSSTHLLFPAPDVPSICASAPGACGRPLPSAQRSRLSQPWAGARPLAWGASSFPGAITPGALHSVGASVRARRTAPAQPGSASREGALGVTFS